VKYQCLFCGNIISTVDGKYPSGYCNPATCGAFAWAPIGFLGVNPIDIIEMEEEMDGVHGEAEDGNAKHSN
jgi:hypothetical protein